MSKNIIVYIDLNGVLNKVGILNIKHNQAGINLSFQNDETWLQHPLSDSLAPQFKLNPIEYKSRVHNHLFFDNIGDSVPDQWGRDLIIRNNEILAKQNKATSKNSIEEEYLFAISDFARQGALRFATEEGGPFLLTSKENPIPPISKLGELLEAANRYENNNASDADIQALYNAGSAIGGARAKVSVIDNEKNLLIAKFPQDYDRWPLIRWEAVTLRLAELAGLNVQKWKFETIKGKDVLLVHRFDRDGTKRNPYLSAWSMLRGEGSNIYSYLHILDKIKQHGKNPSQDAEELFRRLVFNILVSNFDDHFRNHGFLITNDGWSLSPAFDINPFPYTTEYHRHLRLSIQKENATTAAVIDLALETAEEYSLSLDKAKSIAKEVGTAVSQ